MHRLTTYQTDIARAVLGSVLHDRGDTFVVEMAPGAGARELSAQLELLLLTLNRRRQVGLLKLCADPSAHAGLLAERAGGNANGGLSGGLWTYAPGRLRMGRAEQRFIVPGAALPSQGPVDLIEVAEAGRLAEDLFDAHVQPAAARLSATMVLYAHPGSRPAWLEHVVAKACELEASDGRQRHFIINEDRAAAEMPGFRRRAAPAPMLIAS